MENALSSPTPHNQAKDECPAPFVDVVGAEAAWKGEGGYVT